MSRIVVCGYMARYPLAGNVMAFFHYVLGFHRLGHEVVYLEESGWPGSCFDPKAQEQGDDPRTGLCAVNKLMVEHGLSVPVLYVNRDSGEVYGGKWDEVKEMLSRADLLLNVGGVCWLPEFRRCRRLALVDMDPLFTQVGRFATEGRSEYHAHFSYGTNIGKASCTIPTCGIEWQPTVPPVVPEIWWNSTASRRAHEKAGVGSAAFTTIANWNAYGGVNYNGEHYGQKDEEFLRLADLPGRTTQKLEVALSGAEDAKRRLRSAGWCIRDALEVTSSMPVYKAYVTDSRGEFSVAKHAYVKTHSGWFSDRSVCYLAAGRPVVLQDTGFSEWLPTGPGVLVFSTLDEAAEQLDRVEADYALHRRAAREIAYTIFDSRVVLRRLLGRAIGIGSCEPIVAESRL